jgi:hypothetical protein
MKKKLFIGFFAVIFGLCILALLIVQLALTTPQTRELLAEHMGEITVANPVRASSGLGEITLTVDGAQPSNSIKVLQNGVIIAILNQTSTTLMVEDNALIEIDGTKIDEHFYVRITNAADNVRFYNNARETLVEKNIAILSRVFVDNQN